MLILSLSFVDEAIDEAIVQRTTMEKSLEREKKRERERKREENEGYRRKRKKKEYSRFVTSSLKSNSDSGVHVLSRHPFPLFPLFIHLLSSFLSYLA